jgi:hypothetical protein
MLLVSGEEETMEAAKLISYHARREEGWRVGCLRKVSGGIYVCILSHGFTPRDEGHGRPAGAWLRLVDGGCV